jgi:hypothetical protein
MADAAKVRDWNDNRLTIQSAIAGGKLFQLRDGRGAYYNSQIAASLGTANLRFDSIDQVVIPKAAVALLDGGRVFWDRLNSVGTFKRLGANRGFYMGRGIGDALSTDATATVSLNIDPPYDLDLAGQPFASALLGTTMLLNRRGGAHDMVLSATNEAQKVDALGDEILLSTGKGIIEARIKVITGGAGATAKFNVGIAGGTHATNADSITQRLFCHLNSNDTKIYFESGDGTNSVAATDSLKTFTVGTAFEVWFDVRDPTNVKLYVEGIQVLPGTVFNISAGVSNWFLLAHLVKTATVEIMEVQVDWNRGRTAEQSVASI